MTVLTWLGCWGTLVGVCYGTGHITEAAFSERAKQDLAGWLESVRPETVVYGWANALAQIFDVTFGRHHLSVRCLAISMLASLVSLVVWDLLLYKGLVQFVGSALTGESLSNVQLTVAGLLAVSFAVDYVSLLETRFAVSIIARKRRRWRTMLMVVVGDLLCTAAAAILIPTVMLDVVDRSLAEMDNSPEAAIAYGMIMEDAAQVALPVLLSTCTTSFWLWLFVLGSLLNIAGTRLGAWRRWVVGGLNLRATPFLATSIICAILVTVSMASAGAVVTLYLQIPGDGHRVPVRAVRTRWCTAQRIRGASPCWRLEQHSIDELTAATGRIRAAPYVNLWMSLSVVAFPRDYAQSDRDGVEEGNECHRCLTRQAVCRLNVSQMVGDAYFATFALS